MTLRRIPDAATPPIVRLATVGGGSSTADQPENSTDTISMKISAAQFAASPAEPIEFARRGESPVE